MYLVIYIGCSVLHSDLDPEIRGKSLHFTSNFVSEFVRDSHKHKKMMKERFIGNLDSQEVRDKHVLVRVDFNVPITTEDNTNTRIPADISRLKASLPTIQFLCQSGAKVILCSHLGRQRGVDMNLSLKILLRPLQDLVGQFSANVGFVHNCVGDEVEEAKMHLGSGDILLLENLRFHAEEVANDDEFSKQLASSIDLFVNDAFGSSHRGNFRVIFDCEF